MLSLVRIFQPFLIPSLVIVLCWGVYRTIYKDDLPFGLVIYISLQIIVDTYLNTALYIPGFEAGSIRYSEVFFLILYFKFIRKKPDKIDGLIIFFIALYFVLLFASSLRGRTTFLGIAYFRNICIPQICAIIIGFKSLHKQEDIGKFYFYLSFLLIFMGLFVFWDKFFDITWLKSTSLSEPIYWQNRGNDRYGSFFLNPNMYGAFIILTILNVFTVLISEKKLLNRFIVLGGTLLTLLGLVLTHSRGPMLSFVVALFVYMILPNRKFQLRTRIYSMTIAFCLLFIFMPGFFESATNRFTQENTQAAQNTHEVSRLSIWVNTVELIQKYPVFGIGLGESKYRSMMRRETDFGFAYEYVLDNPHNSYLHIAVMAGLICLFAFLIVNIIILWRGVKTLFDRDKYKDNIFTPGLIAGVCGFLASLVVDQGLFTKVAPMYWFFLGYLYYISKQSTVETQKETKN